MEIEKEKCECNYCGSTNKLEKVPFAEGFYFCYECKEKFERQEEMIKNGFEPQPYLE